jgi:hypothetical protein
VSDERCLATAADGEISHAHDRNRELANSKKTAVIELVS